MFFFPMPFDVWSVYYVCFSAHTQSKTLLNRAKHDDYEEIVSCMIDLEDEVQAVFTEKFSQPNIKLTNYMERVFYFPIEVCWQSFHLEEFIYDQRQKRVHTFLFISLFLRIKMKEMCSSVFLYYYKMH